MDILSKGYNALRGEKGQTQTPEETVIRLVDRLQHAAMISDRRASVLGLKGMAREYQLQVGNHGLGPLIKTLVQDRGDPEYTKSVVETLQLLCTSRQGEQTLAKQFSEIFLKDPNNVAVLVDLLASEDAYVRYNVVQFLTALVNNQPAALQNALLVAPMGVSSLVDLLDDKSEYLRNETLLLLITLTQSNADIQKIVAFENVFERALQIVISEGACDGGIIVQDCITLMHNLLRYNVSNQNYFRESSCMKSLHFLFTPKPSTTNKLPALGPDGLPVVTAVDAIYDPADPRWTAQKQTNLILALALVRILVTPDSPNTASNQAILLSSHVLHHTLTLALGGAPPPVQAQALYAIGDMIRDNEKCQDAVTRRTIPPESTSAIVRLVQLTLTRQLMEVRAGAAYAFECYVDGNADAQLVLLATCTPSPSTLDGPNTFSTSPGQLLLDGLSDLSSARKDPYRIWFSCLLLSHLLRDNQRAQIMALSIKIKDDEDDELLSLLLRVLHWLSKSVRERHNVRVSVGYLSLLATWIRECSTTSNHYFSEGAQVQFLIEQINQSSGVPTLVQGLAAYVLALLFEFNDESISQFSRASLHAIITTRIGLDVFSSRLRRLRDTRAIGDVEPTLVLPETPPISASDSVGDESHDTSLPELFFDFAFAETFKSTQDGLVRSIAQFNKVKQRATSEYRSSSASSPVRSAAVEVSSEQKPATVPAANTVDATLLAELQAKVVELQQANDQLNVKLQEHVSYSQQWAQYGESQATRITQLETMLNETTLQLQQTQDTLSHSQQQLSDTQQSLTNVQSAHEALSREQEDLLVCLAEMDIEVKSLKQRLRQYGEVIPDEEEEQGPSLT